MSLITKWNDPKSLKKVEKQALTKQQLIRIISDLFDQMLTVYTTGKKLVYVNPLGLTKDEVIEGFGEDAMELFRLATLLKDAINIAAPGTLPEDNPYGSAQ